MLREGKIWDLMKLCPIQVSNVLELTNWMGINLIPLRGQNIFLLAYA